MKKPYSDQPQPGGAGSAAKKEPSASRGKILTEGRLVSSAESMAAASRQGLFESALNEFFVSQKEFEEGGGSSLDMYREEGSDRLITEGVQEYLSFRLANENFAISILNIKEIIKPPLITQVPRTDPVILGILSLRGTVVPVVDLRLRLGLDAAPIDRKTRILIVQTDGGLIGLLVDEVRHVIRLHDDEVEPPPAVFGRVEVEHLVGVGRHEGEMYTLLDIASVVVVERVMKRTGVEVKRG